MPSVSNLFKIAIKQRLRVGDRRSGIRRSGMGSVVPDTTEAKCSGGGMSYSKLRISCRDTACRVRSQSTSNLCKLAIKQVGLRYNHHQYKKTPKGLNFKA